MYEQFIIRLDDLVLRNNDVDGFDAVRSPLSLLHLMKYWSSITSLNIISLTTCQMKVRRENILS